MGSKNSPSRLWRQPHLSAKPEPNEMVPVWKGRRRLRIWSFRRPGGNGMQQASSDAEGAFAGGQCPPLQDAAYPQNQMSAFQNVTVMAVPLPGALLSSSCAP